MSDDAWLPQPRPLRVGLFGEFSSGKSTLLNSLLGTHVQDTGVKPTTQSTTVIRDARLDGPQAEAHEIVPHDAPLLRRGVALWDTPGPSSESDYHRQRALNAAALVHLALVLLPANEGLTRSNKAWVEAVRSRCTNKEAHALRIVMTKWDRFEFDDEEEAAEVEEETLQDMRQAFGSRILVYRVDARDLSLLDGPTLIADISKEADQYAPVGMFLAVDNDITHPLRQAVAHGEPWTPLLPPAWQGHDLRELMETWERHCVDKAKALPALRHKAIFGAARWFRNHAAQLSSAHEGPSELDKAAKEARGAVEELKDCWKGIAQSLDLTQKGAGSWFD